MAKNVLIGWPNRAPGAVLSGGSWTTLGNLNNSDYWRVARSTDANVGSTIISIDLGAIYPLRAIAFAAHNLSQSSSWRVKLGSTDNNNNIYDSGNQAVWAMSFGADYQWEDQFWWEGYTASDDYGNSPHLACWPLPNWYSARYARIEITDTDNPAGYVQIGKLFIGGGVQPAIGVGYDGMSESWTDASDLVTSASGDESFVPRRRLRQAQVRFGHITADAEFQAMYEMQRRQGLSGEVLFLPEPNNIAECQRRGFIGRLSELSAIEYPYYQRRGLALRIKETP